MATRPTRVQDDASLPGGPGEPPMAPTIPGYLIRGLLGVGGMAEVWEAEQTSLGRRVAIKLMAGRLAVDPHFVRRFDREARALAGLNHPGVVQIHDRGQAGDRLYYVMELVEGLSFREILQGAGGHLPWADALEVLIKASEALAYVHGQGVVHRDFKPENLMVTPQGVVKLADFGLAAVDALAAAEGRLTATNVAMGTLYYMAPEQGLDAARVDFRSDLYSFGVTLYESLTGSYPAGSWRPASEVMPEVPAWIDGVVATCLAPRPEDRYASTAALMADLRAVAAGEVPSTGGGVAATSAPTPGGVTPRTWDPHDQELRSVVGLDLDPDLEPEGATPAAAAAPAATPLGSRETVVLAPPRARVPAAAAAAPANPMPPPPPTATPRLVDRVAATSPGAAAPRVEAAPPPLPDPAPPEAPAPAPGAGGVPWHWLLPVAMVLGVVVIGRSGTGPVAPSPTAPPPTLAREPAAPPPTAPAPAPPAAPEPDPDRLDPGDRKAVAAALRSDSPVLVKRALDLETFGKIRYKPEYLGGLLHGTRSAAVAEMLLTHLGERWEVPEARQALVRHYRLRGLGWPECRALIERHGLLLRPSLAEDPKVLAVVTRADPRDPDLLPSLRLLELMDGDRIPGLLASLRQSPDPRVREVAERSAQERWEQGLSASR